MSAPSEIAQWDPIADDFNDPIGNSYNGLDVIAPPAQVKQHCGHVDLFVGGIPNELNSHGLKFLFAKYGEVTASKIIYPRRDSETNNKRRQDINIGFVTMKNHNEAIAAMHNINGKLLLGGKYKLRVDYAQSKEERDRVHAIKRRESSDKIAGGVEDMQDLDDDKMAELPVLHTGLTAFKSPALHTNQSASDEALKGVSSAKFLEYMKSHKPKGRGQTRIEMFERLLEEEIKGLQQHKEKINLQKAIEAENEKMQMKPTNSSGPSTVTTTDNNCNRTVMKTSSDQSCVVCRTRGRMQCSKCRMTRYCSEQCQKADWPHHKEACGRFDNQSSTGEGNSGEGKGNSTQLSGLSIEELEERFDIVWCTDEDN